PTKVEGNAEHPSSLGATDARAQQMVWDLYDPDRSRGPAQPTGDGFEDKTFAEFDAAYRELIAAHAGTGGRGLRVLLPPTNSPSLRRVRRKLLERFPQAKVHTWESVHDDTIRAGARMAFGEVAYPLYDLTRADVVLSLDSDFLGADEGMVRASRAFGARRAITNPDRDHMLRLYAVEGGFTVTGANADHRLRVAAQDVERFLKALAAAMEGKNGFTLGALAGAVQGAEAEAHWAPFIDALAADLTGERGASNRTQPGRSFVVVGRRQPARVHALGHAINHALGAIGGGVRIYPPSDPEQPLCLESLQELVAEADQVETLLILGGNPAYDAPADLDLAGLLGREGVTSIHLASHRNETSELCTWHVPLAHELETWGDQRAADGTLSIQQPLIAPLFGGRSALEMLALAAGERNWRGHYVVRKTMREQMPTSVAFQRQWRRSLHRGMVPGSADAPLTPAIQSAAVSAALSGAEAPAALSASNLEVQFAPDPFLWDGRHANNLWALETPDPMTKIVWDNAAIVSRHTRDELGLQNGDTIRLSKGGATIEVPVWGLPGQADWTVTLLLGWGRTAAGRYGTKQTWPGVGPEPDWQAGGFDVHPLRTTEGFHFAAGVSAEKSGSYELVQTQTHGYMEGRPIAIDATLEEYRQEPEFASYRTVDMSSIGPLWQEVDYSPREVATGRMLHKWGMVIDLTSCTGCNACAVACQAENNIPCVGKQEVKRGREMAWIRIDRYFVGEDADEPAITMQPIGCQHCEEAPCENVCPVNATAHSPEGLNDMAYNRCIGTRYCANNCPYKVRRFNYLDWHNHLDDPWAFHGEFSEMRQMQFNPNVTVRMRGVMEKCTYCVQRIQEAKFAARREDRQVEDGDIITACQAACPTGAIIFGDLNLEDSRVARAAAVNRQYKLLAEVGAQPRTTFLGKIRNTNPHLGGGHAAGGDEEAHG
ncbi:MAG TPA: 4Fe-4S dicluster domain-containing protein, partial [Polyangiaceae bacterium LLY-WYZ-15_(1-7)]|nr:4Fe-4S dicluster domain-containing protein [Polyangiaceae bacterium LLY-WYZ-15_(1-7)]